MPDTPDDPELTPAAVGEPERLEPGLDSGAAGCRDLVVRVDAKGVILYVSPSFRGLGYEPEELIGRSGVEFVHPDDLASFSANRARLFGGEAPDKRATREFRYRRKDGSWAWLEAHPTILPSWDGRLGDILGVFCDMTERREMSDALRAQARDARSR
jgi:PAS domain S-box-containing protein